MVVVEGGQVEYLQLIEPPLVLCQLWSRTTGRKLILKERYTNIQDDPKVLPMLFTVYGIKLVIFPILMMDTLMNTPCGFFRNSETFTSVRLLS